MGLSGESQDMVQERSEIHLKRSFTEHRDPNSDGDKRKKQVFLFLIIFLYERKANSESKSNPS
jgi:hypothetical protein